MPASPPDHIDPSQRARYVAWAFVSRLGNGAATPFMTNGGWDEMGGWIVGVVMAVLAVLGLFLASGARDVTMEWFGLLMTLFGVGYCYALIVKSTGR